MAIGRRLFITECGKANSARPIGPEGALSFKPRWSADGKHLAFYCDKHDGVRLWVYSVADDKCRPLADTRIKARTHMPPVWSPDNKFVIVPAMPAKESLSDQSEDKKVKSNGSRMLVLSSGDAAKDVPIVKPTDDSIFDTGADIVEVSLADGKTRVLIGADRSPAPAQARLSPTGKYLSYLSVLKPGVDGVGDLRRGLVVVRLADGGSMFTEPDVGLSEDSEDYEDYWSGVGYRWHPTEDQLVYIKEQKLYALDCRVDKSEARRLAEDIEKLYGGVLAWTREGSAIVVATPAATSTVENPHIGTLALVPMDAPPVTISVPENLKVRRVVTNSLGRLWQPQPDRITVLALAPGKGTVLLRAALTGGKLEPIQTFAGRLDTHGGPSDHQFLVAGYEDLQTSENLVRIELSGELGPRLTEVEPRLKGITIDAAESFETTMGGPDGAQRTVRTGVLLPPGAKRGDRLPAIVTLYGGANISDLTMRYGGGDVASFPAQLFTTRGYAVLLVDTPLTPDGQAGQPIAELREAVLPQIYRAAELGYVDLKRLAVSGQSYGGYCTAALITQTNLFSAAIAVSGVYDLAGTYAWMGQAGDGDFNAYWSEKGQGPMGKPLWDDPKRYIDNSPYFLADRIRTPMLIVHGRDDDTCPVQEAEKMFNALRRLGRIAQLAVYNDEGHVPSEWATQNAVDVTNRILSFLERRTVTDKARAEGDTSKDLEKLAGTWIAIAAEDYGEKIPEDQIKGMQLVLSGSDFTSSHGDTTVMSGTFTVDPAKKPKTIDLKSMSGRHKGKTLPGLYKLEGEMLTICFVEPDGKRPTELASTIDNAAFLMTCKREKK